jgi:predicted CopG family antitoxin
MSIVFSMTSTIQLSEETKQALKTMRPNKSYEEIIKELIKQQKRIKVAEDMKEYGLKYGKEGLDEVKEWEKIETPWD